MNEAAITLDGWYVLHDFRQMDWASWKQVRSQNYANKLQMSS